MKVLVFGLGVSGQSAIKFLLKQGYDVEIATDDGLPNKLTKAEKDRLFEGLSFIVVSPGIKPTNEIIKSAKERNIKVIGELELGFLSESGSVIAITGTNGKTTTVSLINFLLSSSERKVFLGGNIGTAYTSFSYLTMPSSISVLECSSFQLFSIEKFRAHIGAILNISEDHLVWHGTMQNYIEAKLNITKNQTEDDFLLLNFDDELLMQQKIKTRAKIFYFSTKQKVVGCYVKGGSIYFNDNLTEKRLISIKNLKLLGEHNLSNVLCGVLAVYLQTKNVEILKNVSKFNGVEHRIEYVGKAGGVLFYNDSKSTNISSTLVATRCFKQNTLLILGGSDKGYGFDELFKNLPNSVKKIAVFGETKQKILKSAKAYGFCKIYAFDNLRQCVYFCKEQAEFGDVVLLSPACASFDQFNNFEERGMVFKKIVKEIILNESSLFEDKKTT